MKSAEIDQWSVNLLEGFDWKEKIANTTYSLDNDPESFTYTSDPNSLDPHRELYD